MFVAGRPEVPGRADKILRSADVNPNTAGARLFAGGGAGLVELEQALAGGRISALWVVGEDVALSAAGLARLATIDTIVQAAHWNDVAGAAKVVLPAAAWGEYDGTITNRGGVVQRVRKALSPRGGSRPHFELTLAIARKLDVALDLGAAPTAVRGVFNKMKAEVPQMASAEWGKPAPLIQLRFAHSRG